MNSIQLVWERNLHQSPGSILMSDINSILISERERYIAEIDANTGGTRWKNRVYSARGYFVSTNQIHYYMDQDDIIRRYDSKGAELDPIFFPAYVTRGGYLRYVQVNSKFLITGGWRGYTDMVSYDLKARKILATRDIRKQDFKGIPTFLNEGILALIGECAEILDPRTLKTKHKLNIPKLPFSADLDVPFTIFDGNAFGCSNNFLFRFNELATEIDIIYTHSHAFIGLPIVFREFLLIADTNKRLCCISHIGELIWTIPLYHPFQLQACLVSDLLVMASGLGPIQVLCPQSGEILTSRSERRVQGGLHPCGFDSFVFGSKGTLVCLKLI